MWFLLFRQSWFRLVLSLLSLRGHWRCRFSNNNGMWDCLLGGFSGWLRRSRGSCYSGFWGWWRRSDYRSFLSFLSPRDGPCPRRWSSNTMSMLMFWLLFICDSILFLIFNNRLGQFWKPLELLLGQLNPASMMHIFIYKLDFHIGINSYRKVKNIETWGVLFKLDLVFTFGEVFEHVAKTIPVVEKFGIDQLQLALSVWFEQLDKGFLVGWTAAWEHALVVKLSTNISLKLLLLLMPMISLHLYITINH